MVLDEHYIYVSELLPHHQKLLYFLLEWPAELDFYIRFLLDLDV